MFSVAGRQIVVVGGTAGIGLAVATHLAKAGARVIITGRRDAAALAGSVGVGYVPMDVADLSSVEQGFEAIGAQLDRLDCLVLNAGIDEAHGEIGRLDLGAFERILNVNTLGIVRALACGVSLVPSGGSIVITSSPAGSITAPGMAAYSASKAALDMLVRTWALELGPRQIRVNAVLPGIIETEMAAGSTGELEVIRRVTANGMIRQAGDMGPVFQFLASAASTPLTGSLVGAHDGIPAGYSAEAMGYLAAGAEAAE